MRREKMNNKGFSLVELIIVIAIMAVLIVVLAPQYLKYVEKSRNSTDVTNATEIVTAIQVYAADPDVAAGDMLAAGTYTITVGGTGTNISDEKVALALKAAGFDVTTGSNSTMATTCVSKTAWGSYIITVKVEADGNVKFEYSATSAASGATDADNSKATQNFKDAMAGKKIGSGSPAGGGGTETNP